MTIIKPEQINEVGEYLVTHLQQGRSLEFALATTQRVFGDQDQPAPIDPHPKPYVQVHARELEADIQQAISQKFAQETHESIQNLQRRIQLGPDAIRSARIERDGLQARMEQKLEQEARAEAEDIAVRDVVFEWAAGLPDGRFVALLEATGLTGYIQATPEEHVSLAKEVLARVRRD